MKKSVKKANKGVSAAGKPSATKLARNKPAARPGAAKKKANVKAGAGKKAKPARTARPASRKKTPVPSAGKKAVSAKKQPAGASASQSREQAVPETETTAPAGGTAPRLNARQRESFQNLLLAMRARLSASISSLKRESLATKDWINMEEDGTDIFEQQFALNIVSSENEMLIQIDEALARLAMNEYGVCEDCGCGIHTERLKALPFVKTCISCQSKKEGHAKFDPDVGMDGLM